MKKKISIFATIFVLLFQTSCKRDVNKEDIGDRIVSPIDIAVSKDKSHYYVLNADMINLYKTASILVIDKDGNKVKAIETPRLGQVVYVSGDYLFAVFDFSGDNDDVSASARLYDISTPANPVLKKEWPLDCSPLNVTARENYNYFAISCQRGEIYIGELDKLAIHKVRDFQYGRRAIYIDSKRELLFAFTTDFGRIQETEADVSYAEAFSYDDAFKPVAGANEVPDLFEQDARSIRQYENIQNRYRYLVYNIAEEAAADFPFTKSDEELQNRELRWLYFHFDSDTVKFDEAEKKLKKYFRTNFWEAKPDEDSEDSFYLSHRGLGSNSSPDANQIVRVSVTGDPLAFNGDTPPVTKDFLNFEQVYNEKNTQGNKIIRNYTSDFEVTESEGRKIVIVNNFRDLSNFSTLGGPRFTISAATLENDDTNKLWAKLVESTEGKDGYYQFAVGQNSTVATVSFYGDSVIFLEVKAGADIKEIKRIN